MSERKMRRPALTDKVLRGLRDAMQCAEVAKDSEGWLPERSGLLDTTWNWLNGMEAYRAERRAKKGAK